MRRNAFFADSEHAIIAMLGNENKPIRDIAAFFAHPEHVIIATFGDENKLVRDIAVDKIISLRETLTAGHTDTFEETRCEEVQGSIHK